MILDGKTLEFYQWDGELRGLLDSVRDNLNEIAEVSISPSFEEP